MCSTMLKFTVFICCVFLVTASRWRANPEIRNRLQRQVGGGFDQLRQNTENGADSDEIGNIDDFIDGAVGNSDENGDVSHEPPVVSPTPTPGPNAQTIPVITPSLLPSQLGGLYASSCRPHTSTRHFPVIVYSTRTRVLFTTDLNVVTSTTSVFPETRVSISVRTVIPEPVIVTSTDIQLVTAVITSARFLKSTIQVTQTSVMTMYTTLTRTITTLTTVDRPVVKTTVFTVTTQSPVYTRVTETHYTQKTETTTKVNRPANPPPITHTVVALRRETHYQTISTTIYQPSFKTVYTHINGNIPSASNYLVYNS